MIFNPCVVIPIYNHKDTIGATVESLSAYALPLFIVDDASNAETKATLLALKAANPLVHLFHLPVNSGKGGAVMHGLRQAHMAGHSHALQIDADGQHDTADVPKFLEHGAARPEALICGQPVYDASVPKGRLYGRYITHFWVWVETLSFAIGDSMCGLRLYPLASTCALINHVKLPTRMDFDPEVLVRLAWRGVQFQNIPTRVIYPAGGLSHFRMLRDNVRISLMHTRLTCGMLLRLPLLLWRKLARAGSTTKHWSNMAERGSALGLRIVFRCYRILGERAARLLLYPVVAYFFLTGTAARRASLDYLRRVQQHSAQPGAPALPRPGWRQSFRHMMEFAQSGLDKVCAWMGAFDSARVDFHHRAEFEALMASGRGAVLIGSHLGNLEMTRALATSAQRAVVNAVVYTDHAQRFNETLRQANADFGVNLIQVSHLGPDTAIMLKSKIDRGELIVIVGDRTPPESGGANRTSPMEFLGQAASFAHGPFILASLLECPVYLFFCLREGDRYSIYLEPFAQRIVLPRSERLQRLHGYMQQYVKQLEVHCLKAPYQWFNFFDFWRNPSASNSTKA